MPAFYFPKQPSEEFAITVDFATNRLSSAESISQVTVTATKISDGSDATSDVIDGNSETAGIVTVEVKGGEAGERYDIRILVTTDGGNKYEADVVMVVEDRP
jgi:hypothetical protein